LPYLLLSRWTDIALAPLDGCSNNCLDPGQSEVGWSADKQCCGVRA
jgi:hypothetical protein